MKLRRLGPPDIPQLVVLEHQIYPQPWSAEVFAEELQRDNRVYLAIEREVGIIAYGGIMLIGDDAHITTLGVGPAARGRGLGTRLMLELVEAALAAGARHLTLEVRVSNRSARELYQRFGLTPVGLRKNYYRDEDALIMWAIDIDGAAYRERLQQIREGLDGG